VSVNEAQQRRLLELGHDLDRLWNHAGASNELKKRIVRTVLHEVVIEDDAQRHEHLLHLHWQGGVHTELRVARNPTGKHHRITEDKALELIRELSKISNDQAIAATLNRLGYRTGAGKSWRLHSVQSARYYYGLQRSDNNGDWVTIEQASKLLGVSHTVVRRLIRDAPCRQHKWFHQRRGSFAAMICRCPSSRRKSMLFGRAANCPRQTPHSA